ncbi:MAG: molybdenum cofactor guanylyltransferase [Bacilli bacterium]|jgi:molybdopterin-guanine dinucleotide biosynthesis protein A|nr:molybdenum cofactor guanylyltransferase [Bacteroidales bacterium]MDD4673682.1 molybdenum cofactor guanylyltransferase [Bacteroidales bacterium]MDY0349488.1 molybdenum cofactor guanylyltransferase [Tenuifilaceae bacterium]
MVGRKKATAIILAGGKSSRMGQDKALLPIGNIPLIQHIINQLQEHFDELIIGANNPQLYAFTGLRVVSDLERGKGPLMGIYTCLKASSNQVNFITACDIPEMNINLIRNMINLAGAYGIVVPVSASGYYEPLYAVYQKGMYKQAKQLLSNNSGRIIDLINAANIKTVDFKDSDWHQNLNKKEEYLHYLKSRVDGN